jgi:hypothetical protein
VVAALRDDLPAVEDDDEVGVAGRGEVVADDDRGPATGDPP